MVGVTYVAVSSIEESPFSADTRPAMEVCARRRQTYRTRAGAGRQSCDCCRRISLEIDHSGDHPSIMLYFLYVLGTETIGRSCWAGGIVYIVAGMSGGFFSDRFGRERILWTVLRSLVGFPVGFFVRDLPLIMFLLPIFGLGRWLVLTLPFAVMIPLMPRDRIGQFTRNILGLARGRYGRCARGLRCGYRRGNGGGRKKSWLRYDLAVDGDGRILISLVLFRETNSSQKEASGRESSRSGLPVCSTLPWRGNKRLPLTVPAPPRTYTPGRRGEHHTIEGRTSLAFSDEVGLLRPEVRASPPVPDAPLATPALSTIDARVERTFSGTTSLVLGPAHARWATPDELRSALKDLRSQGLVARLHTLGEATHPVSRDSVSTTEAPPVGTLRRLLAVPGEVYQGIPTR